LYEDLELVNFVFFVFEGENECVASRLPPWIYIYIECYDVTLYVCINLLFNSVNTTYVFVTCPYANKSYT